jgi:type VI secretion system protein ImpH
MATETRRSDPGVAETLFSEPQRFAFFQAVRLLYLLGIRKRRQETGELARTTTQVDVVRFRTPLTLAFPASEIEALTPPVPGDRPEAAPEMTVNFMGLTGPSGVLPRHYTELLMERRSQFKDETAHRFFDLFNHRLLALFVQAWEKYRFAIGYERGQPRTLLNYLLDLVGMGTPGLQNRLQETGRGMQDEALAYYGGLNGQRPHSAIALAAILSDYFSVPVVIEQLRGQWLLLEKGQCTCLGHGGINCVLGESVILGERVWDRQARFRVRVGPLSLMQFNDFLPGGAAYAALTPFVRWFASLGYHFDVQLILRQEEVPACQLGATGASAPRLGWTTWLKTQPFTQDADNAIVTC